MRVLQSPGWDARFMLPAFFVVNTALLIAGGPGLLFYLPLLMMSPFARMPNWLGSARGVLLRGAFLALILAMVVLGHAFEIVYTPGFHVLFDADGLRAGLIIVFRLLLLYSAAVVFTAVSPGHEIAGAIRWYLARLHVHAADRIYGAVLLVFRFVPRLWEIALETQAAVRMRQCRGTTRIRSLVAAFVYRVVREADAVSVAAEARRYFSAVPQPVFRGTRRGAIVFCWCILYSGLAVLVDRGLT